MCGINGVINTNLKSVDQNLFLMMRDSLVHRGPDDKGAWFNDYVALGHRRLSIIDTTINGHQPFCSADNRYVLVFNGEIYNYQSFKNELVLKGYNFISNSDTEVLLYLFIEYGPEMLTRLNGMFAFAIWDNQKNELFIARDRVGVKPLYYSKQPDYFAFASEPKALFAYGLDKELEDQNLNEWLFFRYVAGEKTLFKNVNVLLPGHFMVLSKQNGYSSQVHQWWNLSEEINNRPLISKPEEWFRETFYSSINYRMVSDVPVGILLSGGLDSSSVAAAVKANKYDGIHTFNVGFSGFKDDESKVAKEFSQKLGFPFHSLELSGSSIEDGYLRATYVHDEPLIHQNDPHLIAISSYAKQFVSVLLSGEGSDELMGGYIRYRPLSFQKSILPIKILVNFIPDKYLDNRLKKLKKFCSIGNSKQQVLWNASNYYPADYLKYQLDYTGINNPYRMKILDEGATLYGDNTLRQALYLDQHTYLCSLNNRNDRTTMAASIECREPFLDYRLLTGLGSLPNKWLISKGVGKYILRKTMSDLLGNEVTQFRKIGFSIPWQETLNASPLLTELWRNLPGHEALKFGILDSLNVKRMMDEYERGDKSLESLLRHLLMFVLWHDTYMNNNI
jgi:asparagine synthase (glutamine-hydrolysing)